jgi:transposase
MKNWLTPDREQLLLLPPSVDEWLEENHLARFVVDVVEQLDLSPILAVYDARPHGSTPYHPTILVALLFYGYATGTMSSRKIERATYDSVPFRFIAGGHHPDHDTIASFRRKHLAALTALFTQILVIAREMKFLKVGTVAIDGTKVRANASKHAAVSYRRAKEIETKLRGEVKQLLALAEQADNTPLADGIDIPAEIARREKRLAAIEKAQRAIEQRHQEEALKDYEAALRKNVEETRKTTEKTLSKKKSHRPPDPPEPPSMTPQDTAQHNFTDPDSRIMPDKGAFTQSYNAQLSVDTETMLVVGHHVSQATNDKKELIAAILCIDAVGYGKPEAVLADAGYFSAENIEKACIDVYIPPGKTRHNAPLIERLLPPAGGDPPPGATPAEKMRHKLNTTKGRALYRLRKMTVEPSIGIIKQALGFRQFLLRGAEKVRGEWGLVCLGYNLKRMFGLKTAREV